MPPMTFRTQAIIGLLVVFVASFLRFSPLSFFSLSPSSSSGGFGRGYGGYGGYGSSGGGFHK